MYLKTVFLISQYVLRLAFMIAFMHLPRKRGNNFTVPVDIYGHVRVCVCVGKLFIFIF